MSARAGLRLSQLSRFARTPFRKPLGRRYQATDAAPSPQGQSTFQRLWHSPVGVKTVHFWAPVMKWALVLAGVSDFSRPAENLSLTQNIALTCTGAIWTRWCFIIKPQNLLLAAVNFFLGCVGVTQVTRILLYRRGLKDTTIAQEAKENLKDASLTAKGIAEDPQGAAKKAVN
ncbi:Mitochondrial pyruvate carrier 2 [Acarospora aff. strigata]|nr:Mitochondrial pyruvate carrier 2 [Acarospora aff. strigata]